MGSLPVFVETILRAFAAVRFSVSGSFDPRASLMLSPKILKRMRDHRLWLAYFHTYAHTQLRRGGFACVFSFFVLLLARCELLIKPGA